MRQFLFPQGQVWVLDDSKELAVASLGKGELGLLIFSDDDLATTYARENGLTGKVATLIKGAERLTAFLKAVSRLGVTHVVVDHAKGQKGSTLAIDRMMAYVEEKTQ